jgi:hypothetical protein
MDKKGSIWERIDHFLKKKYMKKAFDEILVKLNELKIKIDNFVEKAFSYNPTPEDKTEALSLITEVLLHRKGFRDLADFPDIFKNEVKEKRIKFNHI